VKENAWQVTYSVALGRAYFLDAVARLVPKSLEELRRNALPQFQALFRASPIQLGERGYVIRPAGPGEPARHAVIRWHDSDDAPRWGPEFANAGEADPARVRIKDAIQDWSAKWNLTDGWILDAALDALLWSMQHPTDLARRWHHRSFSSVSVDDPPPPIEIKEMWLWEPWDNFESRFNSTVQAKIAEYKASIKALCARIGYDPGAAENRRQYHYEWLALYQCRQFSPSRIQTWHRKHHRESVVESTVTHAIASVARRIALTKRESRRGKKSSSVDQHK
jgi:hypothetical protein